MEAIKELILRLRQMGLLLLIGLILIVYISFGLLYWQQGMQQRKLEEQIASLSRIMAQPLGSDEELQSEYEKVNKVLAPITASTAIAMLVDIAGKNGIDVSVESGKLKVPSASFSQTKVGGTTFQLISFRNIHVQGDYDDIMALISNLDSGTIFSVVLNREVVAVLKRVSTNWVEVSRPGDAARRAEFSQVQAAVTAMMKANNLSEIPNPVSFYKGVATNVMGVDSEEPLRILGFPDITTTAADRGYTGTGSPRKGYVLYGHDKISTANTTLFETVNYIGVPATEYYYTSEDDGTVRQFDGVNIGNSTEHFNSEEFKTETKISVDVDIYIKP
ncbi:MAG: hypothetical protein Q8O55_10385 [Dehalococcoidales bacterium]|nr:hypothetical protein [Dehalococcoidales bacterium]